MGFHDTHLLRAVAIADLDALAPALLALAVFAAIAHSAVQRGEPIVARWEIARCHDGVRRDALRGLRPLKDLGECIYIVSHR
jgi:hypothetical protein